MPPRVSIIVLVWNGGGFLDPCLTALLNQDYASAEIIVVDNASTDGSPATVQKYTPPVRLIRNERNLGFAGGSNVGIRASDADINILLNQDTVVQPGWLRSIVETFQDLTIGIVGCKALYMDGHSLQHAGARVDSGDAFPHHLGWGEQDHGQYDLLTDADYVTGAAFGIHRRVIERLGYLDQGFDPAYYEEVDYCYRARRSGFRVVYQPSAVLYHHESSVLPTDSDRRLIAFHRNRVRFVLHHWSAEELKTFASAECRAIQTSISPPDVTARAHAYWDNLLALPLIASRRIEDQTLAGPLSLAQVDALTDTLGTLHRQACSRIPDFGLGAVQNPQLLSSKPAPGSANAKQTPVTFEFDQLNDIIGMLVNQPTLQGPFPSGGGIKSRLKSFYVRLLSLIMRPYLEPILNQQSAFNARTGHALAAVLEYLQVLSTDVAKVPGAIREIHDRLSDNHNARHGHNDSGH